MIEDFAKLIPPSQKDRSGKAFYSGRRAFESPSDLYIIGLNPGGKPKEHRKETVSRHTCKVLRSKPNWSAYRDESWGGQEKGKHFHQRNVRYLFRKLGLNARKVPVSNLVLARSPRKAKLVGDFNQMAHDCWPFHEAVIEQLKVRVVVCLGITDTGPWVRSQLDAEDEIDWFTEDNNRYPAPWTSRCHQNEDGLQVVTLSHPSVAKWTNPATDPTELVLNALD